MGAIDGKEEIVKASVMIPTFWTEESGPERLGNMKKVIQSLYKQTEQHFELLVAVDGPDDNPTLKYLEGVRRRASFQVVTFSRPKEGVRIASARNVLVENAQSEVLIGIQDNLLPGPDFVKAHLSYHIMGPQHPVFVIGLACRDPEDLTTDHRYERGFCLEKPWFDAWARNFSVTRHAVVDAGGYDEAFDGAWGHEDVELAFRLSLNGVEFGYATEPESVGTYLMNKEVPRTAESVRRQARIFYEKHGFWI